MGGDAGRARGAKTHGGDYGNSSGWVAAFARRMAGGQGAWAYAPTAFWSAQTAGRLLVPLLLRRISEVRLLVSSLVAAVTAVLLLSTAATSVGGVIGASALAGLGVAAIFPLLWAGVTRQVGPGRPAAVGPLFAAAAGSAAADAAGCCGAWRGQERPATDRT